MITERLLGIASNLQTGEAQALFDLNNEQKTAFSLGSVSINLIFLYFWSRTMDGTVNNKWEKRAVSVATVGITGAIAIVNHQTWT